jgi:uncharacterized membrane protein YcaP (DUF421 family)
MSLTELFVFRVSPLELIVRGTAMYWLLFLVFRFVLRRNASGVGLADILFIVIVADAAQNGFAGKYDTVAEGAVLVATLVAWNILLDWLAFRFPSVARFAEPPPLLLIDRGRVLARNLRQEFLSRDELDAQLRQHGVTSISQVRRAYMESDGRFSVLTNDKPAPSPPPERPGPKSN